jgi:hypothetical protein
MCYSSPEYIYAKTTAQYMNAATIRLQIINSDCCVSSLIVFLSIVRPKYFKGLCSVKCSVLSPLTVLLTSTCFTGELL